ncbi:MAG: hypothetical protein C5B55_01320 [Blastocatellia bacterium]|nr:MAG: hypothetical protein C5B55_01320 [Blastocatellia bacterium]
MKKIYLLICCVVALITSVQAHPPTGIVVDKLGNVFFTDLETVWKLDTNGGLKIVRPGISGRHVHELTIDSADNLYGADVSYESQKLISAVWKITPAGQFSYLLAPTSDPPRGMGILADEAGLTYSVEQDNRTKKQTLILRRGSDGAVVTLAGSAYGQIDGKGTAARFGSIGGMAFGPDGSLYLTDGKALRRITMGGEVTTLVQDLTKRTADDRPMLFGTNNGILTGISVDVNGNVFLSDAGNQRLLKIDPGHNVEVVYRGEGEYYPNGVYAKKNGDLYVLEVGFRPPGTWLKPRVRRITADRKSDVIATAGSEIEPVSIEKKVPPTRNPWGPVVVAFIGLFLVGAIVFEWQRRAKRTAGMSAR